MDDRRLERVRALERPHGNLFWLYFFYSFGAFVIFHPLLFLPLYFKFHTLRYKFDDEGVSASWGVLFRREVYLTYRRIQDIHVTRGLLERWLGIATIQIQTAAGSAGAELAVVGVEDYEAVRDFLYRHMRGHEGVAGEAPAPAAAAAPAGDDAVALLRGIRDDLDAVRRALETGAGR